ncbi:MAG: DUF2062 domain-containing protein [Bacteroidota bacterium]
MLHKDFYTYNIIENTEGNIIAEIIFNENHSIFDGHFPSTPIVPGVCQMQIIKEILQKETHIDYQLSTAREIKFLSLINPVDNNKLTVNITYENITEEAIKVSGQIYSNGNSFLKLRAEYKKKNPIINKQQSINYCVIIPTYNNASKLKAVINDVINYTDNIIIVNDGSTDKTAEILKEFPKLKIITHSKNKGKGIALKNGFAAALQAGFEYAITIDSDGQHFAKEIPLFLKKIKEQPNSIIIGHRKLGQENVPGKNSFANKFSNFWYKFQTGLSLTDTQSGYRLYPLSVFKKMKFFSSKYEFELEVIVRASWKGIPIKTVPIDAYYPPKEERITHFRPFRDFLRISILNTIFTFLAILYYKPRNLIRKFRKKKIRQIIKEDIIKSNTPNHIIAISIGFGIFMGITPIWGYQLAIGLLLAHFLKLNKAVVFLAANISLPPIMPFILYLSYVTGGYVLGHGSWNVDIEMTLTALKVNLAQYLIGSIALATISGIVIGFLFYLLLPLIKSKKKDA